MKTELILKVDTTIKANNLDDYSKEVKEWVNNVKTDLKTDEDFVEADELVKAFKSAEDNLKAAKENIFIEGGLSKINDTIVELGDLFRSKRLSLSKLVKSEKESRKNELVESAIDAVCNVYSKSKWIKFLNFPEKNEFADQIKGKSNLDSMKDSLDKYVGIQIQDIGHRSQALDIKESEIKEIIQGYESLFSMDQLLRMQDNINDFVNARIGQHKAEIEAAAQVKAEQIAKEQSAKDKALQDMKSLDVAPTEEIKQHDTVETNLSSQNTQSASNQTFNQTSVDQPKHRFVIRIDFDATQQKAQLIARSLADKYGRECVSLAKQTSEAA